jgi:hypothetical protein
MFSYAEPCMSRSAFIESNEFTGPKIWTRPAVGGTPPASTTKRALGPDADAPIKHTTLPCSLRA